MMKKTIILGFLLGYFSFSAIGSDTLYYRFNNFFVVDGPTDTMVFDLEIATRTEGTYLIAFQSEIIFNTIVFGTNAQPVAILPYSTADGGMVSPTLNIIGGPSNPTTHSFMYGMSRIIPPYDPADFALVPSTPVGWDITWGKLIRYKMLVINNSQLAGLEFNISAMDNNQKFITVLSSTYMNYSPLIAKNNLLPMPTTPTNFSLMFSEVADPTGSNADFVEIYNAGYVAADFSIFPWYLTTWDGGLNYQNVILNGNIMAGEAYSIGGSSFASAYPGKTLNRSTEIVVGGGTLSHYLTIYGEYNEGMFIDYFGGAGSTYTGKHAVRNYNIDVPDTTFNASEWIISTAGNIDMTPGSHRATLTWDGTAGNIWRDTANWANSYVPDAGHNVVIPNTTNDPVISTSYNAYCNNLLTLEGAELSISNGAMLAINCSMPTTANAGPDQIDLVTLSTTLQGNIPTTGTGHWSILSGTGGIITDSFNPSSGFSGLEGHTYTLSWTVTTGCFSSQDNVVISIQCLDLANAGPDQLNLMTLSTTLQGNVPSTGTGYWNVVSGTGGNIMDYLNPVSGFTGIEGQTFTLRWTLTKCISNQDDVVISFACPTASAGPDQLNVPDTTTTLQANTPFVGSGTWSIYSGTGGNIVTPTDPNSVFTGVPGGANYYLLWTVTSNCAIAYDFVYISFECTPQPDTAEAGPDQIAVPGVTTTLEGNTPVIGTGTWIVASGDYGIIADPSNPASLFTGTTGSSYTLEWFIESWCGTSTDYVTISFDDFSCNNSFRDMRDDSVYTTVLIGEQCWMKENLSYNAGSGGCAGYDCNGLGRLYDWNTASSACPSGWHLPEDYEYCTLANVLDPAANCSPGNNVASMIAGSMMKETGTTYWYGNDDATNSSGFSGRGAGSSEGYLYEKAIFWTSTSGLSGGKWTWQLGFNGSELLRISYLPVLSMSVRCVKD
jgi:uncharacterized protein (TIGR02145 family)